MSPSSYTTSTIDTYLRLVRRPADLVVGMLPGQRSGPGAAARVTVDRVDATIRSLLGAALGAEDLSADARMRQQAAAERERAVDLRRQAQAAERQAEEQLDERHDQASRRREQARTRAASRKRQAERTETVRARRARQTEGERLQASRATEQRAEERIEERKTRDRLPAVEAEAEALAEREAALDQADEARRLGDAAARVKSKRKDG